MKKHLLIIGGGFAGFWSAISAIRQSREIQKRGEIDITLVNPDNLVTMPPNLNELSLEGLRFELDKYLKPLGVHQIIGRAEMINPEQNQVAVLTTAGIRKLNYDYLILTSGASLQITDMPGISHTFNVNSRDNCRRLENHIIELAKKDFHEEGASTFVVVGSEIAGLEIVASIEQKLRSMQAYYTGNKSDFRIILLESGNRVASQFPIDCQQYIQDVITSKHVEVITNAEPKIIGPASVLLEDSTRISTRTVIWTKGIVASYLTQFFEGEKDTLNRLAVDKFLKLPDYKNVIAAGNVAHSPNYNAYSSLVDCQYAQLEGRWAGHNAINNLFDIPLKEYAPPGYVICADLGEPQTLYVDDWERSLQKRRYDERAAEKHINTVTMYPWQDVEETVKASFPEIPKF